MKDETQGHSPKRWEHTWGPLVFLTLVAILVVGIAIALLPLQGIFQDVICYWSAAKILASGQNPYDVQLQIGVQHEYGWDKHTFGMGIYDFLPYYYPPWFGLFWMLFLPLGYSTAKLAWFFLNVEMTLLSAFLLRPTVPRVPRWVPVLLASLSLFNLICVLMGQTSILILFLAALSWRLLEEGRDRSAGVVLAWLTIKPQLSAVLLLAVLLRLIRLRRWTGVWSFFITLAVLTLWSTLIVPSWPFAMLRAPVEVPAPTVHFPWIGTSWLLLLQSTGMPGGWAWGLYLGVALFFLGVVVKSALGQTSSLLDVMALSLLAAFFVAPYARHYDFTVLLIPLLALLRDRLTPLSARLLALALVILPYIQIYLLERFKPLSNPPGLFLHEGSFFWIPLLLTAGWLFTCRASRRVEVSGL